MENTVEDYGFSVRSSFLWVKGQRMPIQNRAWLQWAALVALLLLGACSNDPYAKPVGTFGTNTLKLVDARTAMLAGWHDDRERLVRAVTIRGGGGSLALTAGCERFSAVACEIMATPRPERLSGGARSTALPTPIPPSPEPGQLPASSGLLQFASEHEPPKTPDVCLKVENAEKLRTVSAAKAAGATQDTQAKEKLTEAHLFEIISEYASALKDITDAADREAFEAASDKLAASAGALATTLGTLAGGIGAALGPVVVVVVKLGAFATVQAQENARYKALRDAMRHTCLPMRVLSVASGALVATARQQRLGRVCKRRTFRVHDPILLG